MTPRELSMDPRAVRTRTALLNATKELLLHYRVDELSLSQIVKYAQVSRQACYEHFHDKDALILAAGCDICLPAYESFVNDIVIDETYPDQVVRLVKHLERYDKAVKHLINSSVHGHLNDKICNILADAYLKKIYTQIESGEEIALTEETLRDTARFMAAGTQDILIDGMLRDREHEETAQRVENVRAALNLVIGALRATSGGAADEQ
ncbi:TetR/AcrR family transcriptional regulator [Corynebacterium sp. CCUG 61414]|uniref:TetR/AcrR family transcriptional regulator n=1 Tax=Corynebacterium sp. CCUG 61414 TaxID=2823896 RepID=UPI00210C2586|nr:TetR/AcrR family transcriptional regulator [Corynebacterium sp. CCUG 61414]MCQ4610449.1 TetR/AcrR family transcriptional regulator [Corynebacterium sp. CCUG 61414]